MDDIKFKSLNELYKRIYPALESKKKELHRNGINYIHEEDIWNCCKDIVWKDKENVNLHTLVDDILNTKNEIFDQYIKNYIKEEHRQVNEE